MIERYSGPYVFTPIGKLPGYHRPGRLFAARPEMVHVLHAIRTLTARDGRAPSLRELGRHLGVKQKGARDRLLEARRLDLVSWSPGKVRTLRLLTPSAGSLQHESRMGSGRKGRER